MTQKILLIDEDVSVLDILSTYLVRENYEVETAKDGDEGLKKALNQTFHAIILDILLPKLHGFKVLQSIRAHSNVPVIFLTSRANETDTLIAFHCGADDYLTKPCDPYTVLLKLNAILKRTPTQNTSTEKQTLAAEHIQLDSLKRLVYLHDQLIELTNTEFNILEILMKSRGQAFSKEELTEYAIGRKFTAYDRSIDVHISNLRSKLGLNHQQESWIKTVRGFGYIFND